MTLDELSGTIDSDQVVVDPDMITRSPEDLKPGEASLVCDEAVWVDNDDALWVDTSFACLNLDDPDLLDADDVVRVIRVDEGLIVDISHLANNYPPRKPSFVRARRSALGWSVEDSEPVVGLVTDDLSRDLLSRMLRDRYGDEAILPNLVEAISNRYKD